MKNPKPLYHLRQLIYKKYSKEKFALGCEIVARWVAFETKQACTMEMVQRWCNATGYKQSGTMNMKQFTALTKLFNTNKI